MTLYWEAVDVESCDRNEPSEKKNSQGFYTSFYCKMGMYIGAAFIIL